MRSPCPLTDRNAWTFLPARGDLLLSDANGPRTDAMCTATGRSRQRGCPTRRRPSTGPWNWKRGDGQPWLCTAFGELTTGSALTHVWSIQMELTIVPYRLEGVDHAESRFAMETPRHPESGRYARTQSRCKTHQSTASSYHRFPLLSAFSASPQYRRSQTPRARSAAWSLSVVGSCWA